MEWCKKRALEYVDQGDARNAVTSMLSDLGKHDDTRDHLGITLGMGLLMSGNLNSLPEVRNWIVGFN